MSSTHFTFDLADTAFVLFDQLQIHEHLGKLPRYAEFDREVYEATLNEAEKLGQMLAPLNRESDRVGCKLDGEGNVTTPPGFKDAWAQFRDGGWLAPRADPELGGSGMPTTIGVVLQEVCSGACMSFMMYPGLSTAAARVINQFGPEQWQQPVAEKMFTGEWGGTMCLTEAGAGSSVGDNRTKARPHPEEEGVFLLEGEKIWITGGDHDMVDNICHLVLARTPGAPNGVKGLSLFLVPKLLFDDDMNLGERNDVFVTALEHKMGINGSATCYLALGANGPCRGWLVGNECEGINVMFHMMNEARIGVGVQGLAAASAAYQFALHYANERIQGVKAADIKNADAERVRIVEHPDVRRMLMTCKVLTETMRSMTHRLALDFEVAEETEGDSPEKTRLQGRVDLLVPIVKSMNTDLGFDVGVEAMQIFGGYGYTQEFPVEQIVRDAKIQSIYEGTNGIQALDLLGRKLRIGGGRLFMEWMQDSQALCKRGAEAGFGDEAKALDKAIQNLGATAMALGGMSGGGKLNVALLGAVPFMRAMGYTVLGLEALDQALTAKRMIEADKETPLLKGKLLNLKFYVANILPRAIALAKSTQAADDSALDETLFTI